MAIKVGIYETTSEKKEKEKNMFSKELLDYVADGDEHTKLDGVEHSTNLREVVTVGYMVEYYQAD